MKAPEKAEDARNVLQRPVGSRRIVLTGFMGSGKTTVGPLVAERLGWRFVDVDDVIAAEAGTTIPEIFLSEGEAEFQARAGGDCEPGTRRGTCAGARRRSRRG